MHPKTGWYNLLCNRAFIALWVMCWIVYWRYLQLRKKHYGGAVAAAAKPDSSTSTKGKAAATTPADMEAGHLPAAAPLPAAQKSGLAAGLLANATHQLQGEALAIACAEAAIHTGDSDTGDLEQTALMAWDAIVIAVHAIFGFLDLYLRIGGSVAQAVFSPNYKTMLFERFLVTSISIFSAPFILWKLPIAGELFHQMRPTGFDQAGKLRLQMSLGEMKKLYGETRASVRNRGFAAHPARTRTRTRARARPLTRRFAPTCRYASRLLQQRIAKGLDKTAGKLDKAFGLGSKKTNADASKAKPPATHAHTVARLAPLCFSCNWQLQPSAWPRSRDPLDPLSHLPMFAPWLSAIQFGLCAKVDGLNGRRGPRQRLHFGYLDKRHDAAVTRRTRVMIEHRVPVDSVSFSECVHACGERYACASLGVAPPRCVSKMWGRRPGAPCAMRALTWAAKYKRIPYI